MSRKKAKSSKTKGRPKRRRRKDLQWGPLRIPRQAGAWAAGLAGFALLVLVTVSVLLTPECQAEGCPTLATLEEYRPPEPPHVYDRAGQLVGQLPGQRRLVVPLDEISPLIRNGFIAVEDRRFFRHGGVDVLGIGRALVANLRSGGVEEGASTITMQLVRNVFEADVLEYNPWRRKLTEARMAVALEDRLPKARILELYLNHIYLGGGVYGVETAARNLFGVSAAEVTPAQAALIVGLAKNPEGYNPRRHPDRAVQRRAIVLDVLLREGLLTTEAAERAAAEEIRVIPRPDAHRTGAWYLAAVDRRIRDLFSDPRDRQGLRIHTGLDPEVQVAAVEALADQIRQVEEGAWGPFAHEVPSEDETLAPVRGGASPYLQGMVVALDPATGQARALVGGRDIAHSEFDRALQSRRQPGSSFKPFVYAAALSRGATLADVVETGPVVVRQAGRAPWSPRDAGDGEPLTLREALARSSNTAAVRVGQSAGHAALSRVARDLGLSADLPPWPSVFLGATEVVPAELVAAYAAFGNGGHRVVPHLITRVEDRSGEVVWKPTDVAPAPALDPAAAWVTLDAMRGVVDGGTGWRVRQAGYTGPAAGKTGTTDEGKDAWFVGLTPGLAMGVWLGFDAPRPILPGASGGALAAPVWGRIAGAVAGGAAAEGRWRPPAGVIRVAVDTESGARATEHCPEENVVEEVFIAGTEPLEQCPLHGGFLEKVLDGVKRIIRLGG